MNECLLLVYLSKVVLLVIKLDHYGVLNVLKLSRTYINIHKDFKLCLCVIDGTADLLVGVH